MLLNRLVDHLHAVIEEFFERFFVGSAFKLLDSLFEFLEFCIVSRHFNYTNFNWIFKVFGGLNQTFLIPPMLLMLLTEVC